MMRRVVTTIAMILVCAASAAQTIVEPEETEHPRYTVEVIIFEYAEEVSVGTERFLPDEPPPKSDDLAEEELVYGDELTAPPVADDQLEPAGPEFVVHVEEELTMGDVASRLERLDVYRPVMHFAWTQVTRPEEETQPIELRALAEPPVGLEGSFTLYLSRYLHLVVDLSLEQQPGFSDPVTIDEPAPVYSDGRGGAGYDALQPSPVRFRINEDRIFKSGDLRYFDHPKFGVLAKITRVEEPEDEEPEPALVGQLGE
jgi:hypothetical protein